MQGLQGGACSKVRAHQDGSGPQQMAHCVRGVHDMRLLAAAALCHIHAQTRNDNIVGGVKVLVVQLPHTYGVSGGTGGHGHLAGPKAATKLRNTKTVPSPTTSRATIYMGEGQRAQRPIQRDGHESQHVEARPGAAAPGGTPPLSPPATLRAGSGRTSPGALLPLLLLLLGAERGTLVCHRASQRVSMHGAWKGTQLHCCSVGIARASARIVKWQSPDAEQLNMCISSRVVSWHAPWLVTSGCMNLHRLHSHCDGTAAVSSACRQIPTA